MRSYSYILILFSFGSISAQSLNAISHSNLSGTYGSLSNPAFAAGSIDRLSINVAGFGVNIQNNTLRSDLRFSMIELLSFKSPRNDEAEFQAPYFSIPRKSVINPNAYVNLDALQFGIQVAFNKKWSVFGYTRERAFGNFSNLDYDAIRFLSNEGENYSEGQLNLSFDASGLSYQELALGSAIQLLDKRDHFWKVGATYKILNGRAIYAVNVPYFKTSIFNDGFSVKSEINVIETSLDFLTQNPTDIFLRPRIGRGNALDIGAVYEHRPKAKKHTYRRNNPKLKNKNFNARNLIKYDYRIAFSILDIGSITFNQEAVKKTSYILDLTQSVDGYLRSDHDDVLDLLEDSVELSEGSGAMSIYLPATLNLTYDQCLQNDYFFSIHYVQRLTSKKGLSTYIPSHLLLQLRKETEHCSFALPLFIMPITRSYTLGASAQVGPVFLGTNNIGTLFFKKIYNPSFYAGLFYNVRYKKDPTIESYRSFKTRRKKMYHWSPM